MAFKDNPKHVVRFALEPIRAVPEWNERRNWFAVVATSFDSQPYAILQRIEERHDIKSRFRSKSQHINSGVIGEEVEAQLLMIAKESANFTEQFTSYVNRGLVAKSNNVDDCIRYSGSKFSNRGMPFNIRIEIRVTTPRIDGNNR
jgi:hypothetical protein